MNTATTQPTTQPRNHATYAPVSVRLATRYGQGATVDAVPRWRGAALCVHAPIRDGAPTPTRGVWAITSAAYGYAAGTHHGSLRDAIALARLWDAEFRTALAAAPRGADGIPSLSTWRQARAWSRQLNGDAPATGPVGADHGDYRRDTDAPDNGRRVGGPVAAPREPVAAADGDGAEQFPATPTLTLAVVDGERRVRLARRLPNGRERLRDPGGRAVRMNGDVAAFRGPDLLTPTLRLWFAAAWHDVPSIAQLMEWSLDGIAETPDGSRVEPDAPESWLSLLGVV
jgi:hypothetical protein